MRILIKVKMQLLTEDKNYNKKEKDKVVVKISGLLEWIH
jgi:hypothetical protein